MKRVLCLYRPRGWKDEGSSRRASLAGLERVVSQFAGIRRCVLVTRGSCGVGIPACRVGIRAGIHRSPGSGRSQRPPYARRNAGAAA